MNKNILGIFVLALIMIALPIHLRYSEGNTTLPGVEPHYHSRMSESLLEGVPEADNTIVNSRPYILEPYHVIVAAAYRIMGPIALTLLPALLAFASLIFFWLLLRKLDVSENTQLWMLLVYSLSPPLVSAGFIGNAHALILTLLLSGAWLLFTNWWILGAINFVIAAYSGLTYTIAAIVLLIILMVLRPKNKNTIITLAPTVGVLLIGYYPPTIPLLQGGYLSDIGATYGISLFASLLAIVGAAIIWKHKKEYYGAYATIAILLVISFFKPRLLIFANILVSALAGLALATLAKRKWELKSLREAALLVLFCGLLFSSIAHAVNLAGEQPTPEFFEALEFEPGTILTHENYGFWVEAAGHRAVIDPLWRELPDPEGQLWDVTALFGSTDLDNIQTLIKKYNVTHVLITPEMQHGLTWEREEQGLAFIVENSETFKRMETGSSIEVWKVE